MEAYQMSSDDPKIKALNIRGEQSWKEVIQKVRDAEERYVKAGHGWFRKHGRTMTDKSAVFLPVVRLIPNDSFCSVISGGLRLVVELGKHPENESLTLICPLGCIKDQ